MSFFFVKIHWLEAQTSKGLTRKLGRKRRGISQKTCHTAKRFRWFSRKEPSVLSFMIYPVIFFGKECRNSFRTNASVVVRLCFVLLISAHCAVDAAAAHVAGSAFTSDTTHRSTLADTTHLEEVVVVSTASRASTRATAPMQVLSNDKLQTLNALQMSDAVKHFSGVTVKDYGGIGGLKTVSVRSLGAAHTAVSYDGITINDSQNGQIDIGRFSLDNVDQVSLANGQTDDIFQPARQFASAAVLNIATRYPEFVRRPVQGKVSMKGGSFGLLNPSAYLEARFSEKLALTASVEWMSAHGRYPYVLHYGDEETDSSSVELRQNTDVKNLRAEVALHGRDSVQEGNVKAYYYYSERGLPGATIFYNTANFSSQRLWDQNAFVQGYYRRNFGSHWAIRLNAKYNYAYTRYLDPVYLSSAGKDENLYHQQECYISIGGMYRPIDNLTFSLSTDGSISTLDADLPQFVRPTRYLWLTALAGKYVNTWVTATASVLLTAVDETTATGTAASDYFRASPYVSASFRPFQAVNLRLRLFYKNIFRMPTFNDLYYGRVGNRSLKPENTNQYNIGIAYQTRITQYVPNLSITVDGYHNSVTNKIVAYPTKNIYTWTMLNYGRVSITGVDLTAEVTVAPHDKVAIDLGTAYTYCRALNVTDLAARDYRHQIPYTPRVSGSAHAALRTPWFTLGYSMVWSGHRYAVNQNYAENRVEGYSDHSLSLSHEWTIKNHRLGANIECLNLTNKNYTVVRYFPMPGRSWRATIHWKF